MDRRMSSLLLFSYVVVGMIVGGGLAESWIKSESHLQFYNDFSVFFLFAIPSVLVLGLIKIVLAISDAATSLQVVDERYFSRCLVYRILSVIVVIVFGINQYQWALQLQIDAPILNQLDSGIIVFMNLVSSLQVVFLALMLNGAVSFHVISGLISSRNSKTFSVTETVIHSVFQIFLGLDIISSIYLMRKERLIFPNERLHWKKNVTARNSRPIPGFFGTALGIAAIWTLIRCNTLLNIGVNDYLLDIRLKGMPYTNNQNISSTLYFLFLFFFVIWALLDVVRHYRKPSSSEMNRLFKCKTIFYAVMSLLLEAGLFYLVVTILTSLNENIPTTYMMDQLNLRNGYGLFTSLPILAILLVHLSMILYTRLLVKLRLLDESITDYDSLRYLRQSLIPVVQIVAMIELMRMAANSQASVPVEPTTFI